MKINEYCEYAHSVASEKGWWDDEHGDPDSIYVINTKLLLINCEIAEAVEDLRADDMNHFGEEMADVAIRLFDLCYHLGIDLEQQINRKMEINKKRSYRHGKKF